MEADQFAAAKHALRLFGGVGAKFLLTTEKDLCNLTSVVLPTLPVYISIIDLKVDGEIAFLSAIDHLLQARGAQA